MSAQQISRSLPGKKHAELGCQLWTLHTLQRAIPLEVLLEHSDEHIHASVGV